MTWTISISDFRDNFAEQVTRLRTGDNVILKDEKRNEEVGIFIPAKKKFDPIAFRSALDRFAGSISAKTHPEWATERKVEKWLRAIRKQSDRRIYVSS